MTEGTGNAANDFDYDFDGLPNLIEYLLGLDPTVYDSEGAVSAEVSDVGGTDYLTLTFDRDLAATGVSLSVRATSCIGTYRQNNKNCFTQSFTAPITQSRGGSRSQLCFTQMRQCFTHFLWCVGTKKWGQMPP